MNFLKKLVKFIAYAVSGFLFLCFGLIILSIVLTNFMDEQGEFEEEEEFVETDFDELINKDKTGLDANQEGNNRYAHHRIKWKDYTKKRYAGDIYISQDNYEKALTNRNLIESGQNGGVSFAEHKRKHRALFKNDYYTFYWSWVYLNLHNHDKNIEDIYTLFDTLQLNNHLNRRQFADILVSAIQYIPYTLVHSKTCKELLQNEGRSCKSYSCLYHQNKYNNKYANGHPCLPEIEFGLQSPAEFLYNLKGDCDTRSVLAYTLFQHYGYDAVVLLSRKYGHCVLGLALPANGDFVRYKGKKYYFWEMTAKRWELGEAPPDYNVMAYWHVAAG